MRPGRARGHVDRDHRELAELGFQVTPLVVELARTETVDDLVGAGAAVERDAAIALFLRAAENVVVVPEREGGAGEVGLLRLDLLQADDVGLLPGEPAVKALLRGRAQAVDV